MQLVTFKEDSMPKALARVKREFGSHAVIVHTRTYKRGGLLGLGSKTVVEITARKTDAPGPSATTSNPASRRLRHTYAAGDALNTSKTTTHPVAGPLPRNKNFDPLAPAHRLTPPVATPVILPDTKLVNDQLKGEMVNIRQLVENLVKEQRKLHAPQMPEQLFDIYLELIQREVAEELARDLMAAVQDQMTGNQIANADLVRNKLIELLDAQIHTSGPICRSLKGRPRVVALIGPTGVGKTTTVAKLAANFKLRENKNVGLITIDTYRIGAVEQLRTYAQIIDVPLQVVVTPPDLKQAIQQMAHCDIILIDTAGRSQTDQLKLKELKAFLDAAQPDEVHLVLSGTAHHSHMLSAAEEFKKLGVDRLIFTKLDEAISFGVLLSVLKKINASLSYITTGQDVPDDIEIGNGRKLAQMLLAPPHTEFLGSPRLTSA